MGTVCSSSAGRLQIGMKSHLSASLSGKENKRHRGRSRAVSMTSSSDVAVDVVARKAAAAAENGTATAPNSGRISEERHSFAPLGAMYLGASDSEQPSPTPGQSKKPVKTPSPVPEKKQEATPPPPPPPPQPPQPPPTPKALLRLPVEVRNLLTGSLPVPPAPKPRVLRLYVAGDDADSLAERLTLTKTVFPRLRVFAEKLGWHLEIVDTHWPLPTHTIPPTHLQDLEHSAMEDDVTLWLIFLNEKLGWSLPASIPATDFTDISTRLPDEESKSLLQSAYCLDENQVPASWRWNPEGSPCPLGPGATSESQRQHQQLYDLLEKVMTEEQAQQYLSSTLCREVKKALSRRLRNSNSILVVTRELTDLPPLSGDVNNEQLVSSDVNKFFDFRDNAKDERLNGQLVKLRQMLEEKVSGDYVLRCAVSWEELLAAHRGKNSDNEYLKVLQEKVEKRLQAAISGLVADQTHPNRFLASGVPPTLCSELLMHTQRRQDLCARCAHPSPVVSTALERLASHPHTPLLVHGPPGCGLSTVAAHLAQELSKEQMFGIVALRFLGGTPDSQTLLGALFSVLEQVCVVLGESRFKDLHSLTCTDVFSCITACASVYPVTLVLSDVKVDMLEQECHQWPPHNLPHNVHVITLTSDKTLVDSWTQQTPADCVLEIPEADVSQLVNIFSKQLELHSRYLTSQQHSAAVTTISRCPRPVFAMLLATLAAQWTSDMTIKEEDLPSTVDGAVNQVLAAAEKAVGRVCVARIMSYITLARCGLSDSEIDDVISMDDNLVVCVYPQTPPALCRSPLALWLYLKTLLAPYLEAVTLHRRRVYRLGQQSIGAAVRRRYLDKQGGPFGSVALHAVLADYFMGRWANKPKIFNDPEQETEVRHATYVMPQPDSFGRHSNCRKFSCFLYHLLHGSTQTAAATFVQRYLHDVTWMAIALDATSVIQMLDDLHTAKVKVPQMEDRLSWLQTIISRSASSLSVSGRHLRMCLYSALVRDGVRPEDNEKNEKTGRKGSKTNSLQTFKCQLLEAVTNSSTPLLYLHYPPSRASSPSGCGEPSTSVLRTTNSALTGLFPATPDGRFVVSISRSAGEIIVWDTATHRPVRTLRGIDQPLDLAFLDQRQALVLCNRELKTYDLNDGRLVSKLRGMLNLKMPYFRVRDPETVIMLTRNRMSVNVMNVHTGHIHATFKAGEDRFMDSLLVSGDGRVLVCGDETQKPFPLLVWELHECKLLHDLRLPQHEFLTSIASITLDGQYIACACKELDDPGPNFVVVYDLASGQLYRRFKMAASVTCLSVASMSMAVVMVMDDGSVASFNLVSGNCNFHVKGVRAVFNKVQLSIDETVAITYSTDAGTQPAARTLAVWNLQEGQLVASYTFDSPVTCCRHLAHNKTVLVGLSDLPYYVILSLTSELPVQTQADEAHFGDPSLDGHIFDLSSG